MPKRRRPTPAARRKTFGTRVRELRLAEGWSQEDLAERAGLHRNYVGGIERGERNPALDNIWRLADALGVAPGDLFG
jgi:transcriptional regulator with XRE-family HTH domain